MTGTDSTVGSSAPSREAIPSSLLEYDHWISWREGERDGKTTKLPIDPETGDFASTTDPGTWASFETVAEQVKSGDDVGVGFVFSESDPFVGVDLDDCRDPESGQVDEWARDVIETLDSFTEVSPSGSGFHVLVEGSVPGDRNRRGDLELYETARFFTVTARHVPGTPTAIRARSGELEAVYDEYIVPDTDTDSSGGTDVVGAAHGAGSLADEALLEKAQNAANGEKFRRLWRGSTSGYESHSEADMALCSLLAFWTGGDASQMDRLFRGSGLMREKWDEVHYADGSTYGEKTIERAIAGTSEFYEPGADSESTPADGSPGAVEQQPTPDSEVTRMVRIEELEREIDELLATKADLETELEAERERRRELEAQLQTGGGGVLEWLTRFFSSNRRDSREEG